jgi:hypothetical protein
MGDISFSKRPAEASLSSSVSVPILGEEVENEVVQESDDLNTWEGFNMRMHGLLGFPTTSFLPETEQVAANIEVARDLCESALKISKDVNLILGIKVLHVWLFENIFLTISYLFRALGWGKLRDTFLVKSLTLVTRRNTMTMMRYNVDFRMKFNNKETLTLTSPRPTFSCLGAGTKKLGEFLSR